MVAAGAFQGATLYGLDVGIYPFERKSSRMIGNVPDVSKAPCKSTFKFSFDATRVRITAALFVQPDGLLIVHNRVVAPTGKPETVAVAELTFENVTLALAGTTVHVPIVPLGGVLPANRVVLQQLVGLVLRLPFL